MTIIVGFVVGAFVAMAMKDLTRTYYKTRKTPSLRQLVRNNRIRYADDHKRFEENYRQAFGDVNYERKGV